MRVSPKDIALSFVIIVVAIGFFFEAFFLIKAAERLDNPAVYECNARK